VIYRDLNKTYFTIKLISDAPSALTNNSIQLSAVTSKHCITFVELFNPSQLRLHEDLRKDIQSSVAGNHILLFKIV